MKIDVEIQDSQILGSLENEESAIRLINKICNHFDLPICAFTMEDVKDELDELDEYNNVILPKISSKLDKRIRYSVAWKYKIVDAMYEAGMEVIKKEIVCNEDYFVNGIEKIK